MRIVPTGASECLPVRPTLGLQRDGALAQFIVMPREKLFPARLTPKEFCFVEPLTIGFMQSRADGSQRTIWYRIFGCGGVGLGAIAGSNCRGARTICVDVDDEKLEVARAVVKRTR